MKQINFTKWRYCLALIGLGNYLNTSAQSFSTGTSTFCSTTVPVLPDATAADGMKISPKLWLNAPCLDTDLAVFSLNSPVQFRKPTFCYDNQYFPAGASRPLAVKTNTTANSGNCAGARANTNINFVNNAPFKPKGLSFTICDVDNPYDTIQVLVYSGGALANYTFQFAEPNPDSSYAWACANYTGNNGNNVTFNGGANGVWGESSASQYWERGAIYFTVDTSVAVDSVVVSHIVRNNRNDLNPAWSIGAFQWTGKVLNGIPDLTPTITVTGGSNILPIGASRSVNVRISNLITNTSTLGEVQVRIKRPNPTTDGLELLIGSTPDWTIDASNPAFYILTLNTDKRIDASPVVNGFKNIPATLTRTGGLAGQFTLSATIPTGLGGGEINITNNVRNTTFTKQ
ncbi:MAG: hypothetical protein JNM21_06095 [Taibaiella sp.]|nr:hypothetical protein [Taibaiella sp.]